VWDHSPAAPGCARPAVEAAGGPRALRGGFPRPCRPRHGGGPRRIACRVRGSAGRRRKQSRGGEDRPDPTSRKADLGEPSRTSAPAQGSGRSRAQRASRSTAHIIWAWSSLGVYAAGELKERRSPYVADAADERGDGGERTGTARTRSRCRRGRRRALPALSRYPSGSLIERARRGCRERDDPQTVSSSPNPRSPRVQRALGVAISIGAPARSTRPRNASASRQSS